MPLKEDLYYLHFPKEGGMLHHVGPHGEAPHAGGRKKQREILGHSFDCVFHTNQARAEETA